MSDIVFARLLWRCNSVVMPVRFTKLGFSPGYRIEVDPTSASSGDESVPAIHFGAAEHTDLVIRVHPLGSAPWVGSFATGPKDYLIGIFAGPGANQLLVATGIEAVLINVGEPTDAHVVTGIYPVTAVVRPDGADFLLIASFNDLACIDATGLRWTTRGLFIDDLEFVEGSREKLHVRGYLGAVPRDLDDMLLDPQTGDILAGR